MPSFLVTMNLQGYRSEIFHCLDFGSYRYFPDGLLLVENGRIVALDHYDTLSGQMTRDTPITQFKNALLIPGFIDTHVHYPQYRIIGSYGAQLLQWLNRYTFPEEQKFHQEEYAAEVAKLFFDELLRNGTTTALSYCATSPVSVDAYFTEARKRGLRMLGGKNMMDRNAPPGLLDTAASSYRQSQALLEKWHRVDRLGYAVKPRFAPTSTPAQLTQAGRLFQAYRQEGVLAQTHINENTAEIAWVKKLFPECADYLQVYEKHDLIGEGVVFGHAIYNTEREIRRLSDSRAWVALCPTSNLFMGSGLFDLERLRKHDVLCALASDIGGGTDFSLLRVMREAYKVCQLRQYNLEAEQAFYLTTLAGAKALRIDDRVGNLLPGKEADFVILDYKATELINDKIQVCANESEKLFSVMILGDERMVSQVYVLGNMIYERKPDVSNNNPRVAENGRSDDNPER